MDAEFGTNGLGDAGWEGKCAGEDGGGETVCCIGDMLGVDDRFCIGGTGGNSGNIDGREGVLGAVAKVIGEIGESFDWAEANVWEDMCSAGGVETWYEADMDGRGGGGGGAAANVTGELGR